MQVETSLRNNTTITFIVADSEKEADKLKEIAPEGEPVIAVLEPQGTYLFPYLKIIYEGAVS